MSTSTGSVVSVEVLEVGSNLAVGAAAGATTLSLERATQFSPDGGTLSLDGDLYDFTASDEATTVTIPPLPSAYDADLPVRVVVGGEVLREHRATVNLDDPDAGAVEALIPTPMLGRLAEGEVDPPVPVELGVVNGRRQVLRRLDGVATLDSPVRVSDDAGGNAGGVNELGDVSARGLSYTSTFDASATSMFVDGVAMVDVLANFAQGKLFQGSRDPLVTGISAEYGILQMDFYLSTRRAVRFVVGGGFSMTTASGNFRVRLRQEYSATAPVTASGASPIVVAWGFGTGMAAAASMKITPGESFDLEAGYYSLRLTVQSLTSGSTVSSTAGASLTVSDDGPIRATENLAYAPPAPGALVVGGTNTGSTAAAQKKTYTKTYDASASRWYNSAGVQQGAGDNNYFGDTPAGVTGVRRTAIWFPSPTGDLAGATVTKVEVFLFLFDGGTDNTVVIGSHGDATVRDDYGNVTGKNRDLVRAAGWNEGSGRWVSVPGGLDEWRTGAKRGIVVDPSTMANPDSSVFSGGHYGATHPKRPILRVTYQR